MPTNDYFGLLKNYQVVDMRVVHYSAKQTGRELSSKNVANTSGHCDMPWALLVLHRFGRPGETQAMSVAFSRCVRPSSTTSNSEAHFVCLSGKMALIVEYKALELSGPPLATSGG